MVRSRLLLAPLLLGLTVVGLSGCGRRGPLEAPPDASAPDQARNGSTGVVEPNPDGAGTRTGLARDTNGPQDALLNEQVLAPKTAVTVPKTPFILDPLL